MTYHNGTKHYEWYEFDRIVLIQYTGLKDKKGKEIYEDDVINDSLSDRKGRIRYNEHSAAFELADYDGIHVLSSRNQSFFEVIGNIYEHPNLLKEANQNVPSTQTQD